MIATLINHDEAQRSYLVVIIQPENLDRMKKADPISLETRALQGILDVPRYPEKFGVLIAYEEDDFELNRLAMSGHTEGLIRYIMRGWQFKRDLDGTHRAFKLNPTKEKP